MVFNLMIICEKWTSSSYLSEGIRLHLDPQREFIRLTCPTFTLVTLWHFGFMKPRSSASDLFDCLHFWKIRFALHNMRATKKIIWHSCKRIHPPTPSTVADMLITATPSSKSSIWSRTEVRAVSHQWHVSLTFTHIKRILKMRDDEYCRAICLTS